MKGKKQGNHTFQTFNSQKRNKKGQAAMEFLMTYGWAILVVLIAISALAYFGVLNPSRFLPESCVMVPGIACVDFKIAAEDETGNGTMILVIRNGLGTDLTSVTVKIKDCILNCTTCATANYMEDASEQTWQNDTCSTGNTGKRFKEDIILGYTKGEDGLGHTDTGQLITKIE